MKNCTYGNYICNKELKINDKKSDATITLYTDLTLNLDGYKYTVDQLRKSTYAKMKSFVVSKVGNTIVFVSHVHGFWVIFDEFGDVKIGVSAKHTKTVDGLCGYFNGKAVDDKRLPNGEEALSVIDFGDGWLSPDASQLHCEPHACPKELQDKAWDMCNIAKDEAFKTCGKAVNIDRFISKCLETACECLLSSSSPKSLVASSQVLVPHTPLNDVNKCKCAMLQNYVEECLAADENIHLDTWRSVHDCPTNCPAPLVHNDCFRRRCEPACDSVSSDDCPHLPGTCFSGCYCPEGTVRKGDICVPISDCQDCVCDGFGKSQYLTYDRKNFTFDGNCTYLLSRDLLVQDVHTFQVYATLGACDEVSSKKQFGLKTKTSKPIKGSSTGSCTQALHILYGPHIIHLQKGPKKTIKILADGIETKSPIKKEWIEIQEVAGRDIKIKLPKSHVEINAAFDDMSFSIKVPSVKYGFKMEGLCGDCNGNPDDDLQRNPKITKKGKSPDLLNDIVQTWLSDEPQLPKEDVCLSKEVAETDCIPLPPEKDPCFEILDQEIFGHCHLIVEPLMYVSSCQADMCKAGPYQEGACKHVAAYAKECARNDICIDWKKGLCKEEHTECPTGMIFMPCGCPKTCEMQKLLKTSGKYSKPNSDYCSTARIEGCFCPAGKVIHNGTCIPENQCTPCDDKGHYPADKWSPDKCLDCVCNADSNVQCTKRECSTKGTVCKIGWKQVTNTNKDECCPTFTCVPEPTKKPSQKCTDDPPLPNCGTDQNNKLIEGSDGCPKYICDCKPYDECTPLTPLNVKLGEKVVADVSGCCPTHKVVCDKSKCPVKPVRCDQEFYEVYELDAIEVDQCCIEFICKPPKNKCLIDIDGKKYLKNPGDKWSTSNPCITKLCSYGPNGVTIVTEVIEKCPPKTCDPGSELKTDYGKCCGTCIQTKCVVEDTVYKLGDVWYSPDNCTSYKCMELNDKFIVATMHETCPDISSCPETLRYSKGCCEYCKTEPEDLSKYKNKFKNILKYCV